MSRFRILKPLLAHALAIGCAAVSAIASDQIPGAAQTGPIAIVGGDIYPVSSPPIIGGTVIFENGKITAVGRGIEVPANAQRIDAGGKRVYPGLFDPQTDIGLTEIGLVRQSSDTLETGALNPNAHAETALNPDSEQIPVARANGVLLGCVTPAGGLISGSSAVIQLDGWTNEDLTIKSAASITVNWPNMRVQQRRFRPVDSEADQNRRRDEQLKKLKELFDNARAYGKARSAGGATAAFDSRLDAMQPLIDGTIPMVVNADDILQIESTVAFAQREKVKLIICGGYDAPMCAELLRKNDVPVILSGVHRLPMRRNDAYDAPFTLAARLHAAGVRIAISTTDRFNGNYRNLPYNAATAAAYGLPADEALAAITLHSAELFGVADRVGSLAVGRDATLFVADGDIFDIPTHVERAFIGGRAIDLGDKQKTLYHKYLTKYAQQRASTKPAN